MKENIFRYVEVKEKLIKEISLLEPHVRLPSRTALAEKYTTARTTIERAISELIGEGYLYAKDGSGTYVADRVERKGGMSTVGLIIPDIRHDTYPGILRGVEDVMHRHNMHLVVCNTDNQVDKQSDYIHKLTESGVRGLIIVPAIIGQTDLSPFQALKEQGIPFVFCNRGIDGVDAPKVVSNNFYGAYIAVKHLLSVGCRHIAYISRPVYSTSYERYQGYTSALQESGLTVNEQYVMFGPLFRTKGQGYQSTRQLLTMNPRPDGIFCFNDGIAMEAYEALTEAGLRVGQDIRLIGYDNTSICERLPVKLTSVKFKTYEIGVQAAQLMIGMINEGTVQKDKIIVMQPELVVRESTAGASEL